MRKTLLIVSVAVFGLSFGCGGGKSGVKPAPSSVSTFTDNRDGKVYRIVEIGGTVWMAENLNFAAEGSKCYGEGGKVASYENGSHIRTTISNAEVQAYCKKYGRLYNWKTAVKACPAGYHLPSNDEWTALVNTVGDSMAGTKLKSAEGWVEDGNGTNDFGWSALPGGNGDSYGIFYVAGYFGGWWSATEVGDVWYWYWCMSYEYEDVGTFDQFRGDLFSVRCVQNKEAQK